MMMMRAPLQKNRRRSRSAELDRQAASWSSHGAMVEHRLLSVRALAFIALVCSLGRVALAAGARAPLGGLVRQFFVQAEEAEWDYLPSGWDWVAGVPAPESMHARVYTVLPPPAPARIGTRHVKLRFVEYEDASFATPRNRSAEWLHLGLIGPVLHAEVGDQVRVVLRNRTPGPVSLHPHGVRYDAANEGLPRAGEAPHEVADDAVAPGSTYEYIWDVPERAGPSDTEGPSSVGWLIHSHYREMSDTMAGLIAYLVVTRRGWARPDGRPADVDREFLLVWLVTDEFMSRSFSTTMQRRLNSTGTLSAEAWQALRADPAFRSSLKVYPVNGRIFNNLEGLTVRVGERVRWYSAALGSEVRHSYCCERDTSCSDDGDETDTKRCCYAQTDLHTPHWHGNTVLDGGERSDTVTVLPATTRTNDMVPDQVGTFWVHCHVHTHMMWGMSANYTVLPCEEPDDTAAAQDPAGPPRCRSSVAYRHDDQHASSTPSSTLPTAWLEAGAVMVAIGATGMLIGCLVRPCLQRQAAAWTEVIRGHVVARQPIAKYARVPAPEQHVPADQHDDSSHVSPVSVV